MSSEELEEILGDEYTGLSSNKYEAFLVYENRVRKKYLDVSEEQRNAGSMFLYASSIVGFAEVFEIEERYLDPGINARSVSQNHAQFEAFEENVLTVVARYKAKISKQKLDGISDVVEIQSGHKTEIRGMIEKIKFILDNIDLDWRKKDKLFSKLNTFLDELDREKTRLTAWTSAVIQVAGATGDSAKKLEPVAELFDKIAKSIGAGAKEQDALPKWEEQKKLPSPESIDGAE